MDLQERLMADLKDAMRERDERRVSTIRLARSAIKNAEIAQRRPLNDQEVLGVLMKEAKQRRESIVEFRKGRREDLVSAEEAELAILQTYLPQQLSEEELTALAREVVSSVGAKGPNDLGKVMPVLMGKVRGRAEGRAVNETARKVLAEVVQQ
jgi:uncharacterized protein